VNEHDELTEQIIGALIEVHRVLGPGLLESIYEEALAVELTLRGLEFRRQVEVDVVYKGHVIKGQCVDLLVGGEVVVGAKSVTRLPDGNGTTSFVSEGNTPPTRFAAELRLSEIS
jgi:GxxExxY protein